MAAVRTRSNGRARARTTARPRASGCAARPIPSRAAPRRSSSTSSPSACWACPAREVGPFQDQQLVRRRPGQASVASERRIHEHEVCGYKEDGVHGFRLSRFALGRNDPSGGELMPLVLSDEQQMLRESARGYLAEQAPVAHLRKLRDERDDTGFSRALWRGFAEMGWPGVLIAEEFGGVGLGHVEAGVLLEEMGRTLAPSPFPSTAVVAASAIGLAGSAQHKAQHLPRIAAGELVAALAIDEGAKHKPSRIALAAARHANGFRLNGTKTFVIDGHVADLLIVAARTAGGIKDKQGVTLFLVDAKTPGLARERTIMVDSRNAARLAFENVDVTADAVL